MTKREQNLLREEELREEFFDALPSEVEKRIKELQAEIEESAFEIKVLKKILNEKKLEYEDFN